MNKININLEEKYVQGKLKEQINESSDGLVDSKENVDDNIKNYDGQVETHFTDVEEFEVEDKGVESINVTDVRHESIVIELKKGVPSLNLKGEFILNLSVNELLLELSGWKDPKRNDGIGVSLIGNDLKCEMSCKFSLDPLQSYVSDSLNCARKFGLFVKDMSKVEVGKNVDSNCSEFLKSFWDRISIATHGELEKNVSKFMVQKDCETIAERGETDLGDREIWLEGYYIVEFIQVHIYRIAVVVMETEKNESGKIVNEEFSLEAANDRIVVLLLTIRKLKFSVKDTEGMGREMEKDANFIASLYTELEVMKELESAIKKLQQHQHEDSRNAFGQKLTWQLQDVKHLKDVFLWNQTYGMVIELLASTTFARLGVVFGNVCSRYASFSRPRVGFLQDLHARRLDSFQNRGSHKVLADAT